MHPYIGQKLVAASLQECQSNAQTWAILAADRLYHQAAGRRWRAVIWALLRHRSRRLLHLAQVEANSQVVSRHYAGVQTVPIRQIRGSASKGRSKDFDIDFYSNQAHDEQRWKSVAAAWLDGQAFPPVELIQVGDTYFVRDGHHRVSIARAMGQTYMDAEVTVWQVAEPVIQAQPEALCLQSRDCLAPV